MLENKKLLLIPLAVLIIFLGSLFYYLNRDVEKRTAKKPDIVRPKQDQDLSWYIEFTVRDQTFTAYTEESGAPLAASGSPYFIGSVAVHPLYADGNCRTPIIPFGTTIFLEHPITIHQQSYDRLVVNDTGDVYYRLWPSSPYWVDIYWGPSSSFNQQVADKYGIKSNSYSWYEKWR